MILAEKIAKLRKQNSWSQEDLAMKLNVSRQSVSKWESTASIPDLDKIIKMSELFDVSTDYLIKDTVEVENNIVSYADDFTYEETDNIRSISLEEANIYMNLVEKASIKIAAGVATCILSPTLLILLAGLAECKMITMTEDMAGGIGVAALLLLVAGAVASFIMTGLQLERYEYLEKEALSLQYGVAGIVEGKKEKFDATFKQCIAIGVSLCICSVVPMMIAAAFESADFVYIYCVDIMLALIAFAVYLFIWACMIHGSYQKLLEEGDYTREKKAAAKKFEAVSFIYWSIITAIYLGYSFVTFNWQSSWIIWPCAGVLYGALLGVITLIHRK